MFSRTRVGRRGRAIIEEKPPNSPRPGCHPYGLTNLGQEPVYRTSDSFLKMDIRSAHAESRSRRHVFETNANGFALILQLHRTKPVDHLAQEASIRQREAGGVDPIHDL